MGVDEEKGDSHVEMPSSNSHICDLIKVGVVTVLVGVVTVLVGVATNRIVSLLVCVHLYSVMVLLNSM